MDRLEKIVRIYELCVTAAIIVLCILAEVYGKKHGWFMATIAWVYIFWDELKGGD